MNGNNINDVYVDEEDRIWLANYPTGITIRNNRYGSYDLIRHSLGNTRSLVNDQVHDVVEDSDGDLWFATSNGISFYQTDTKEWRSFFSSFDPVPNDENHIFLALCEVSPGVMWAGGYTSGIYKIEKKKGFKVTYLSPAAIAGVRPDQYIYDIKKDSGGDIWSGGYYHLKRINLDTKNVRLYPGVSSITTIQEKDDRLMWIGTRMGLYLLDKESGIYRYIDLPVESPYICALYQREDGILYIGTRGAGLLVYDINKKKFIHQYRTDNCALISDNIYTILPRQDESLLMGTETGITIYSPQKHSFRNWTREQGLMSVSFNAGSATTCNKSMLVFGGNDGAVKFPTDIQIPEPHYSRLLLLIAEMVNTANDTFINNSIDSPCQVIGIRRSSDLVENNSQTVTLFSETNHRLYEIIAKSRIEPCGTDNDCLLAVIHYLLFSFQFSGAVYRIRARIAVFRVWSMRSTVKYIVSRYLYHGSTIGLGRTCQLFRCFTIQFVC